VAFVNAVQYIISNQGRSRQYAGKCACVDGTCREKNKL